MCNKAKNFFLFVTRYTTHFQSNIFGIKFSSKNAAESFYLLLSRFSAKIWSPHTKADILANCDVLLVPQATLGAKLKGKQVQFHGNCEKTRGLELWSLLVDQMKQNKSNVNVEHGTYGNRQVLCMDTDGPFSRVFDI